MPYYVRRLPDGSPAIVYRSGPDGDFYISLASLGFDGVDAADVDATIASIKDAAHQRGTVPA